MTGSEFTKGRKPKIATGPKLLLIMGAALLPLGIIGLFASLETAQNARESRNREAGLVTEISARTIADSIDRTVVALRAATNLVRRGPGDTRSCAQALDALGSIDMVGARFAIFDAEGVPLCISGDFDPGRLARRANGGSTARLDETTGDVRVTVGDAGSIAAMADIPAAALRKIAEPVRATENYRVVLSQAGRTHVIHDWPAPRETQAFSWPVAGGQLTVESSYQAVPLRTIEALAIMLPMLMWLAAAAIVWFAVNRILLRPLAGLERAVAGRRIGDPALDLPIVNTPAIEIKKLAQAFQEAVATLHRNERELEAGMAEQTRLNREVHHRVKNNLQVVSSLLSLHARAAKTPEIAEAYLSIQRRVDALAIVQRNLFSDIDKEPGIAIRPVIAELASGLQQTAPAAARLTITVNIAAVRVSQDTALPVAFLITELVELAMVCDDESQVTVEIDRPDIATERSRLSLHSPAFIDCRGGIVFDRYDRVLAGLSRQLRAALDHDLNSGSFSIMIPVLPPD